MPIDPNTGLPITTSSSNLPGYLQQQSTPGITGGIDNMLRALLASQYAPKNSSGSTGGFNNAAFAGQQSNVQGMPQSQPGMMAAPQDDTWAQGTSAVPYLSGTPGAAPMDPTMAALFSQPPS
jgi:hypothetical protein